MASWLVFLVPLILSLEKNMRAKMNTHKHLYTLAFDDRNVKSEELECNILSIFNHVLNCASICDNNVILFYCF